MAISTFNLGKEKNWDKVHKNLQQEYVDSQQISVENKCEIQNITPNQEFSKKNQIKNVYEHTIRDEWPYDF